MVEPAEDRIMEANNLESKEAQKKIMSELAAMPLNEGQKLAVLTSCIAELTLSMTGYDLDKAIEVNKEVCRTLLKATITAKRIFGKIIKKQ